jgi:hypothetical protein
MVVSPLVTLLVASSLYRATPGFVLCKILCNNPCCLIQSTYELGIEASFWD